MGIQGNNMVDNLTKSNAKAPPNAPNGNAIHINHHHPHYLHNKNSWNGPIQNLDTQLPNFYKHLTHEVTLPPNSS